MNLEIHKPGLADHVQAHIQNGRFHNADELIERALDALERKTTAPPPEQYRREAGRKSLVEVFAPLRGLDLDFSRNKSTGRPVDFFMSRGFLIDANVPSELTRPQPERRVL